MMQEISYQLIEKITLEQQGNDYYSHRIPGLVCTRCGTFLAYCESRSGGDWSVIDITLRISTDDGRTWSPRRVLVPSNGETVNNPVMITSPHDDTIHFLYQRGYAACYYQQSNDEGKSWTEPINITDVFEEFRAEYDWIVIATGPGHGICTQGGRLLVPVWLSSSKKHIPSRCGCIYSDDNGVIWQRGGLLPEMEDMLNPNETCAAELPDGRVMFQIRSQSPCSLRAIAISNDRGITIGSPGFDPALPDPQCAAGITIAPGGRLLFVNCNAKLLPNQPFGTSRRNLSLRESADGGRTWSAPFLLDEEGGYADICINPVTETMICYYESGWYENNCTLPLKLQAARFAALG